MRISDWSSDVCSSDLAETKAAENRLHYAEGEAARQKELLAEGISSQAQYDQAVLAVQTAKQSIQTARQQSESVRATLSGPVDAPAEQQPEVHRARAALDRGIGRASCREGVCRYGLSRVVAVSFKKKKK